MRIKNYLLLAFAAFSTTWTQAQEVTDTEDGTEVSDSTATSDDVTLTSTLIFPNAFSPNGDQINDTYGAKEYKNIEEFHAYIFNRWGQKLYEWDDPEGGWDGTYNGKDVKQSTYFVLVKARGADGQNYNIRKDVNLLRGYTETTTSE